MDVIMPVVFSILFIIMIGVIMYLVYDYMQYKDNIDKSFDITTKHVNDSFAKVSENIDEAQNKIQLANNDIHSVSLKTDAVMNSFDTFRGNYTNTLEDIDYNFNLSEQYYRNLNRNLQENKASLNAFGSNLQASQAVSKSLDDFDTALKKYFKFSENDQAIVNNKLFQHTFSGINPNLELLSQVHTASGLTITTPLDKVNNKNLRICNSNRNCINMNVDDNTFNISPENLNNLVVNSKNNNALATFDLQNDSIYFGGSDLNAPMFIQNSNLYLNNLNFIVKEEGTVLGPSHKISDLSLAKITGGDIYALTNSSNTTM